MPSKAPNNGRKPAESSQKAKDADKGKNKKPTTKDGDEEMTVVVPPSKTAKSQKKSADADGDVDMGGEEKADDAAEKVDPAVQAIAGM